RPVGAEIQVGRSGVLGRPFGIGPPAVGARLKRGRAPARLFPLPVEIVAEERGLDRLAVLPRRLVTAQRDQPDAVRLGRPPLAVKPRTRDHEIRMIGVMLRGVPKDLPRSPWVFLIPEPCYVQVRDRRRVELADPCFSLPEAIVIGVRDHIILERDGDVEVVRVYVREWPEG